MKKIFLSLACLCFIAPLFAASQPEQVSVSIDLNLHQHTENRLVNEFNIKNQLKLATSQHEWTIVGNSQSKDKHILLLSKVDEADAEQIKMSFLLIDTGDNPTVISKPELIVSYGQKGQIVMRNKHEKLQLFVEANA